MRLSETSASAAATFGERAQQFFAVTAGEAEAALSKAEKCLTELSQAASEVPEEVDAGQLAQVEAQLRKLANIEVLNDVTSSVEGFESALSAAKSLFGAVPEAEALLLHFRSFLQELDRRQKDLAASMTKRLDAVTQRITKSQLQEWMELDAGAPRTESERLAKASLEEGRTSQGALLEALSVCELKSLKPGSRPGAEDGKGVTLGLYTYGNAGKADLTKATKDHPYLLRLSLAHYRQLCDDPVTSVTIGEDVVTGGHIDNNLGTSKILTLGEHTGGGLFVDKDGICDEATARDVEHEHEVEVACHKGGKPYRAGDKVLGSIICAHGQLRTFDAFYVHWTQPFQGKRFTITYYISRAAGDCPAEQAKKFAFQLGKAGGKWPTALQLQCLLDAKASDKAFRKICHPADLIKRLGPTGSQSSAPVAAAAEEGSVAVEAPPEGKAALEEEGEEESPAVVLAAKKAALDLLAVSSNNKGGDGTKMVTDQRDFLLKKISKLSNDRLKGHIRELLEAMLIRNSQSHPEGTFQAKTSGTFRVFVLEVLKLLDVPRKEINELRESHKLTLKHVNASEDTKRALRKVEKITRAQKNGLKRKLRT